MCITCQRTVYIASQLKPWDLPDKPSTLYWYTRECVKVLATRETFPFTQDNKSRAYYSDDMIRTNPLILNHVHLPAPKRLAKKLNDIKKKPSILRRCVKIHRVLYAIELVPVRLRLSGGYYYLFIHILFLS